METGQLANHQFNAAALQNSQTSQRIRWVGLLGLSLLVLVTRIPLRSQVLYHWDSVNFAYAMQEFNLANEQPQPPGYLLYVWLCRLVDLIFRDPQTTMVSISIAASLIGVLGMYYLGRTIYNERVGWLSAGFLAFSPLFWFYGEIALPHTLDAMFVIWSIYFLYRVMLGERKYLFLAVLLLAVAGGIRQQTLVFLAPAALFAVRKVGIRNLLLAAVAGAALCLAWFIPLMQLSGGLTTYLQIMGDFSRRFQTTTSLFAGAGWWGLRRNAIKLIFYSLYGWNIVILPIAIVLIRETIMRKKIALRERSFFFALWIAPATLFYILIHMGQQGLVFVFLPALMVLSAAALDRWLAPRFGILLAMGLLLMMISGSIFYLMPEYPLGADSQRLLTRSTIINSDAYYEDRFQAVRSYFSPQNTLILASNWHHVEFYLPEYKYLGVELGAKWEVDEGAFKTNVVDGIEYGLSDWGFDSDEVAVIIFDRQLSNFFDNKESVQSLPMSKGESLDYFSLFKQDRLYLSQDSYGIVGR